MPRGPNTPSSPGGFPDDAFHDVYGNPTSAHPNVEPLFRDDFEADAALFVQLSNQEFITPESDDDPATGEDATFSIALTSLPIVQPGDLSDGLLLYTPRTSDPRSLYEVINGVDAGDADAPVVSQVELRKHTANAALDEITPASLTVTTSTETMSLESVTETLTFLLPETLIYTEEDES